MTHEFKAGDVVCYSRAFLKSTAWYTDVPINGRVLDVDEDYITVLWHDRTDPIRVRDTNLILYKERHLEPR